VLVSQLLHQTPRGTLLDIEQAQQDCLAGWSGIAAQLQRREVGQRLAFQRWTFRRLAGRAGLVYTKPDDHICVACLRANVPISALRTGGDLYCAIADLVELEAPLVIGAH
jgi:hypothetical protein